MLIELRARSESRVRQRRVRRRGQPVGHARTYRSSRRDGTERRPPGRVSPRSSRRRAMAGIGRRDEVQHGARHNFQRAPLDASSSIRNVGLPPLPRAATRAPTESRHARAPRTKPRVSVSATTSARARAPPRVADVDLERGRLRRKRNNQLAAGISCAKRRQRSPDFALNSSATARHRFLSLLEQLHTIRPGRIFLWRSRPRQSARRFAARAATAARAWLVFFVGGVGLRQGAARAPSSAMPKWHRW